MAPNTPLPLVKVVIGKNPAELGLHNRWHPEIPAVRIGTAPLHWNAPRAMLCVIAASSDLPVDQIPIYVRTIYMFPIHSP